MNQTLKSKSRTKHTLAHNAAPSIFSPIKCIKVDQKRQTQARPEGSEWGNDMVLAHQKWEVGYSTHSEGRYDVGLGQGNCKKGIIRSILHLIQWIMASLGWGVWKEEMKWSRLASGLLRQRKWCILWWSSVVSVKEKGLKCGHVLLSKQKGNARYQWRVKEINSDYPGTQRKSIMAFIGNILVLAKVMEKGGIGLEEERTTVNLSWQRTTKEPAERLKDDGEQLLKAINLLSTEPCLWTLHLKSKVPECPKITESISSGAGHIEVSCPHLGKEDMKSITPRWSKNGFQNPLVQQACLVFL